MKEEEIRKVVREGYAQIARSEGSCCTSSCSCSGQPDLVEDISKKIGYRDEELNSIPDGANLGLGCGNPTVLASLKEGETVIDLGSGAGFDCFLAANIVGIKGRVIGIDMTPEMIDRARNNASKDGYNNVEFRLGEIENIPAADSTADLVMSNCVINLSPDKSRVFREAFRVLKPGGRLMVSDMVLLKELAESIRESAEAYVGCIAGAMPKEVYLQAIKDAGFTAVQLITETGYPLECGCADQWESIDKATDDSAELGNTVSSITVRGIKP